MPWRRALEPLQPSNTRSKQPDLTSARPTSVPAKIGPSAFELMKVIGEGGYGKVKEQNVLCVLHSVVPLMLHFVTGRAADVRPGVPSPQTGRCRRWFHLCHEGAEEGDHLLSWRLAHCEAQASIVRSKKDVVHTKSERNILELVKVSPPCLWSSEDLPRRLYADQP